MQVPALQLQSVQTPTIINTPPRDDGAPRDLRRGTQPAAPGTPVAQTAPESAERNDFQDFVAVSSGKVLSLFGYNLFQNVPSTFAPVENIPVTSDYVIGPGDELHIRAWGQIDVDYRAVVDRNGSITVPRVGAVSVAGIRYQDLTGYVKTALSRDFRNFELIVTLGNLRSIQIFVVGKARRPGTYTISSLSTLVNAIFAAGGPSTSGSMRSIQVKRGNRTVADIDLYDLLLYGDKSKDTPLLPGDVLYFPPSGPLAAVAGSVKTPAIFELKGDVRIEKLIEWAGGLTTTAQTRLATIERIESRRTRVVDNFSLDQAGLARSIKDGDLVTVFSISPKFDNAVTLRGNVAAPLRYPYRGGMRVRDLIPEKEALITPDYYLKKNLAVRIDPASVRNSLTEINWDYAVIERLNEADLSPSFFPFDLGKAILENDADNNLVLKSGDIVTIFSKDDFAVPVSRRSRLVRLEGEFRNAGGYQALPGETLRQLVVRAGGLFPGAYLFGAEFTRESTRAHQQRNYDEALARIERELQSQTFGRAQNVLSPEDAESVKAQVASQQSVIARLRQLKPAGRVVLKTPENGQIKDLPDLPLEDGDRLYVPPLPSMVNVFGAVNAENSYLYNPGDRVADYFSQAGGPTGRADVYHMFVLRANGSVVGRSGSGLFSTSRVNGYEVVPGDTIVVPEDYDRTSFTKNLKDWTQILYQFGLGAAAIKILRE